MKKFHSYRKTTILFAFLCIFVWTRVGFCDTLVVKDVQGRNFTITHPPKRVVSLVPSVTEAIFALGAADSVKGVTYHDTLLPEASEKAVVGGFFEPSVSTIKAHR